MSSVAIPLIGFFLALGTNIPINVAIFNALPTKPALAFVLCIPVGAVTTHAILTVLERAFT